MVKYNLDIAKNVLPYFIYKRIPLAHYREYFSFKIEYGFGYWLRGVRVKYPCLAPKRSNILPITPGATDAEPAKIKLEFFDNANFKARQPLPFTAELISSPGPDGCFYYSAPAPVDADGYNVNFSAEPAPKSISNLNFLYKYGDVIRIDITGQALAGAPATIVAGKKVIPAGYPGQAGVGTAGAQGPVGATGPAGTNYTTTNGFYYATIGTNDQLANIQTAVTFVNSSPQLLLPAAGTYLLTAVVDVLGEAGVAVNDVVTASLYNTTIAGAVEGSAHKVNNLINGARAQIVINAIYSTAGANQTVALYADCTTSAAASIVALNTSMSYVRVA